MAENLEEGPTWEVRLEPYKKPIVFTWESLIFSGSKVIHGAALWVIVNALCILLHLYAHTVLHCIGLALVLAGLAVLLLLQLPLRIFDVPRWSDSQELLYQEICSLLRIRQAEFKFFKDLFFTYRETEPLKFYMAALAVLLLCQMTLARLPFTLIVHGICVVAMALPLVHTYHIRHIAHEILLKAYHFAQALSQRHQQPPTQA